MLVYIYLNLSGLEKKKLKTGKTSKTYWSTFFFFLSNSTGKELP